MVICTIFPLTRFVKFFQDLKIQQNQSITQNYWIPIRTQTLQLSQTTGYIISQNNNALPYSSVHIPQYQRRSYKA